MPGLHLGHGRFLSTTGQRVLVLGIGMLLLAFLGHAPALVLLGLVIALLPAASVLLCGRDLSGIGVVGAVELPQLVVGGTAPLALTLTGAHTEGFVVTLTAPTVAAEPLWVEPAHGRAEAVVPVVGVAHGFLTEALIELEHVGPWGLSASRARAVMQLPPWPVIPSTRVVPAPALPGLPVPEEDESGVGRAATSGVDPRGMRGYRSGDEPRAVNWRATARTGTLTVREWDPPRRVAGVLLVPVLPSPAYVDPARPRASEGAELVLGALGSLGLAAAAEDRRVSLHFHGTCRTSHGTALTAAGLQNVRDVPPEELLATLAGVRQAAAAPLAAIARSALPTACAGSTVLVGIDAGTLLWSADDLLAAQAAVAAAGCALEVVLAAPAWGLRPETQAAFAALATRCPVTPVETVVPAGTVSG